MTSQKLSLCVFIDAFGWEILQKHKFLDDILVTKSPVETVLGYSCTCDPTIITGKMPYEHGHFSFFYYNPQESPFGLCRYLRIFPKSITSRGRVRHWISKLLVRYLKYTGYFQIYNVPFQYLPLFDYSEKRDIYEAQGINSGDTNIFDYFRANHIRFSLSDWRCSETVNINQLQRDISQQQVRFAYLYLAAMDAVLHQHGTEHELVAQKIQWYDQQLRQIVTMAEKHYQELELYIFSDHGMTNTQETCDLIGPINSLGLQFGKDYVAMYDSTMARFWFFNNAAREQITQLLSQQSQGQILSQQQLQEYGCYFPDGKYGELFFLMHPGVLLCPSFMGEKPLKGMHGYDPQHRDSVAMLASNMKIAAPKRLDGLYDLMKNSVS